MKIKRELYPLLDTEARAEKFDDMWKATRFHILATSKNPGDQTYFPQFRELFDYISREQDIKTYLIAETVSEYMFQNAAVLTEKLWAHIPEISDQFGCLIFKGFTFFYRKFNDEEGNGVILYVIVGSRGEIETGVVVKDPTKEKQIMGNKPTDSTLHLMGFVMAHLFLPFLEFATIETKVINAEKQRKVKIADDKYITDINSDITIVDSNWFTTIIHSGGFGVKGHFKLQPWGKDRQHRKLIWVDAYEKSGYTKKARIIKINEK